MLPKGKKMVIHVYKGETHHRLVFSPDGDMEGYAQVHPETGIPYEGSFLKHYETWEFPDAYWDNSNVMVPAMDKKEINQGAYGYVPVQYVWKYRRPKGARKLN